MVFANDFKGKNDSEILNNAVHGRDSDGIVVITPRAVDGTRDYWLLDSAVLLALIYPEEEKYIVRLMDQIYAICDEYTWCLPAHQGKLEKNNNCKIDIPDLRLKSERDKWRNDTFCTFEESAGDMFVPCNAMQANRDEIVPDSVYDEVRRKWEMGEPG